MGRVGVDVGVMEVGVGIGVEADVDLELKTVFLVEVGDVLLGSGLE